MKRVKATSASLLSNKVISELHRVANPGEEFEVTDDRFLYLSGNNPERKVYVVLAEQVKKKVKKEKEPEIDEQGNIDKE